jgi:hypothetical protein
MLLPTKVTKNTVNQLLQKLGTYSQLLTTTISKSICLIMHELTEHISHTPAVIKRKRYDR